jgi:hypothetical protein
VCELLRHYDNGTGNAATMSAVAVEFDTIALLIIINTPVQKKIVNT